MNRVLILAIGDKTVASSRVRIFSYMPYLNKSGIRATVLCYTPSWHAKKIILRKKISMVEKLLSKIYSSYINFLLLAMAYFYDVIYIQKVALSPYIINMLKIINRNYLFDFDDAIYCYKDIRHITANASAVVVANKYLEAFALKYNKRVFKLASPVEPDHKPKDVKNENVVTMGWIGSPETSEYLYNIIPVFKKLKQRHNNFEMAFMGLDGKISYELALLGAKIINWSLRGENDFLEEIDMGIMPLESTDYAKGKAGYKLLQYMAKGVACVASPVGINNEIIKHNQNGFLASTQDEWLDRLDALVRDRSLRMRIGLEGYNTAKSSYSYEVNAPRLLHVLDMSMLHKKGLKNAEQIT